MTQRSYRQICGVAKALDLIGERWTLLIVRELLAGPRRYTDLHADLPGVSTDVLATRLKELERDDLVTRRRLPPPGTATVYQLTERGQRLSAVLGALADWGVDALEGRRVTDAIRAHWAALPLLGRLIAQTGPAGPPAGVLQVEVEEGVFQLFPAAEPPRYADGPAERPDARLTLDPGTLSALLRDETDLATAIASGGATVSGTGPMADALQALRPATAVGAG